MTKRQSFPSYFKDQVKEGMSGALHSIVKGAGGVAKEIGRGAKAHVNGIKKAWDKAEDANAKLWEATSGSGKGASAVTRKAMSRKSLKTKK